MSERKNWRFFLPALLPAGFVIFLNGVLGSYTRPMGDDFCSLYYAERFGLLRSIWYWRLTWSGRYSAFAADWLEVKLLGADGLYLTPLIALALWLVLGVAAIHIGLRSAAPGGRNLPASILIGTVLLFTTLALSPDIRQSIHWWNGMRSYTLPLVLLTLYAVLFQLWAGKAVGKPRPWLGGFLSFGLLFISGGLSETFTVAQLFLLAFLIAVRLMQAPKKQPDAGLVLLLGGLLGAMAALIVIISAPGNAVRQSELPPSPNLAELVFISSQGYAKFLADIFLSPEKAAALSGAVLLAAWLGAKKEMGHVPSARWIRLYALAGILLAFTCFPPGVYGYSEPPPPRALIIPIYFLTACLLYAGFLTGNRLKKEIGPGLVNYGLAGTAILFLAFSAFIQSRALYQALPAYMDYARIWDEQNAQILQAKADGRESITIPAIRSWARLELLNDNPKYWVNVCYTKYYGIPVFGSPVD